MRGFIYHRRATGYGAISTGHGAISTGGDALSYVKAPIGSLWHSGSEKAARRCLSAATRRTGGKVAIQESAGAGSGKGQERDQGWVMWEVLY